MFKRINNWHLVALVAIVSISSLALIQQYAQAQWTDPGALPGGTPASNLVVNPMTEDLQLGTYNISGDNIVIDPDSMDVLSIDNATNDARLCLNEVCKSTWPVSTSGLWEGANPGNIYYTGGNVGIGTSTPSVALEVFGFNADESNLKLQNPSGDMRLIFQEYFDPPTAYGDMSLRYNGTVGGFNNWLEFWGRDPSQGGGRPIMTMQRDYVSAQNNYFGVGIGVPAETNINAKLRVQGGPDGEDIFQAYDTSGNVRFAIDNGGQVFSHGWFGLGTSAPARPLHVKDLVDQDAFLRIENDYDTVFSDNTAQIEFARGPSYSTDYSWIGPGKPGIDTPNGSFDFWTAENIPFLFGIDGEKMRITTDGKVGIGTATPIGRLHVDLGAGQDYAAYFNGNVTLQHTSGGPYNYLQIDHLSAGATPPLTDCDDGSEKGRMIYDYSLNKLYICDDSAWMGVLLKP